VGPFSDSFFDNNFHKTTANAKMWKAWSKWGPYRMNLFILSLIKQLGHQMTDNQGLKEVATHKRWKFKIVSRFLKRYKKENSTPILWDYREHDIWKYALLALPLNFSLDDEGNVNLTSAIAVIGSNYDSSQTAEGHKWPALLPFLPGHGRIPNDSYFQDILPKKLDGGKQTDFVNILIGALIVFRSFEQSRKNYLKDPTKWKFRFEFNSTALNSDWPYQNLIEGFKFSIASMHRSKAALVNRLRTAVTLFQFTKLNHNKEFFQKEETEDDEDISEILKQAGCYTKDTDSKKLTECSQLWCILLRLFPRKQWVSLITQPEGDNQELPSFSSWLKKDQDKHWVHPIRVSSSLLGPEDRFPDIVTQTNTIESVFLQLKEDTILSEETIFHMAKFRYHNFIYLQGKFFLDLEETEENEMQFIIDTNISPLSTEVISID
jgi:hypothetical protein